MIIGVDFLCYPAYNEHMNNCSYVNLQKRRVIKCQVKMNCMTWRNCLRCLAIRPESGFCLFYLRSDLAETLNMTQSAISHQLKILKQNKLVKGRREGKSVFYSLADDHVRTIIEQGIDHIAE